MNTMPSYPGNVALSGREIKNNLLMRLPRISSNEV